MVWQPSFQPQQLPRQFSEARKKYPEHLEFTIGTESDKGLEDLTFLVNPKELQMSMNHMSQVEAVRGGWMIEHAGQALDVMNVTGSSPLIIVNGPGLTTACDGNYTQPSSLGRQFIDQLILIFKDNGSVRNATFPYVIDAVGFSWVFYDGVSYIGRFDTLTISENSQAPYKVDFSFTFTIHEKV